MRPARIGFCPPGGFSGPLFRFPENSSFPPSRDPPFLGMFASNARSESRWVFELPPPPFREMPCHAEDPLGLPCFPTPPVTVMTSDGFFPSLVGNSFEYVIFFFLPPPFSPATGLPVWDSIFSQFPSVLLIFSCYEGSLPICILSCLFPALSALRFWRMLDGLWLFFPPPSRFPFAPRALNRFFFRPFLLRVPPTVRCLRLRLFPPPPPRVSPGDILVPRLFFCPSQGWLFPLHLIPLPSAVGHRVFLRFGAT